MSIQNKNPLTLQGHVWLSLFHLLLIIHLSPRPVTAQPVAPAVDPDSNKSVVTIMAIIAVMFLISGFLSLYSRKCNDHQPQTRARLDHAVPTGANGNGSQAEPNGLNKDIIDTFPTFLYSDVKGLKMGKDTLACAVCLNEFQDDETLRMVPTCCHVYHPDCIDPWLASHTTCPLCRANLVPTPEGDTNININMHPVLSIQIPDDNEEHEHEHEHDDDDHDHDHGHDDDNKKEDDVESPKVDMLRRIRAMNQSRPSRSRSTGYLNAQFFPRSNSMGQLVQPAENYERFTLRLPDEVQSQMVNTTTLKRTSSCVCFTRMSSGTWGYRTRSVTGRGYVPFGSEEQWCFNLTPPRTLVRSNRSVRKSSSPSSTGGVALDNNVGERSCDNFLRLG
ncbi:hypothetical protein RJT34_12013 [Clitoria ternatea]|uniref:RING-type E3 ubiquitin transferase n=1 Tax=Clitoria ternatea TaxID=43366 RepID=A0AAN9JL32_CLITE